MDNEEIKRRVIFGDSAGYGNPPEQNRFQKGQSGNPKGRPKKASSELSLTDLPMLSAVLAVANKTVPVRDGGEMTEMSMLEAVVAATAACAVKGNARSQATFIGLAQKAHEAEASQRRKSIEFWNDYKRTKSALLAEAKMRGEPAASILPHPDDIVIDHANGPRFLGPFDENEQADLDATLRLRDTLMMQDELDHRSTVRLNGEPLTEPGSARLIAILLERAIPPRLRLSDSQWLVKMMRYQGMSKRELHKTLFNTWHKLGFPRPRGFVFPNVTWTQNYVAMVFDLVSSTRSGELDPASLSLEELAHVIYERATIYGIAR